MSAVVRMPFSARDAEATETLASRATVVIVGAASVVPSLSSPSIPAASLPPTSPRIGKRFSENVYSGPRMPYDPPRGQGDRCPRERVDGRDQARRSGQGVPRRIARRGRLELDNLERRVHGA